MGEHLHQNQKLLKRLAGYSGSAGALLAIGTVANSQVIYSGAQDINIYTPFETIELDLDGDMVSDFEFMIYGYDGINSGTSYVSGYQVGYAVVLNPRTDTYLNSWLAKSTMVSYISGSSESVLLPNGIELGEIISESESQWTMITYASWAGALAAQVRNYYTNAYYSYSLSISEGEFLNTEQFLGVRFNIDSELHYGWIRLSIDANIDSLTIHDWAYESTPGESIQAGEGIGINLPPVFTFQGVPEVSPLQELPVTIYASENITGLEPDDILVTNGSLVSLDEIVAGREYTANIHANSEGEVNLSIIAGAASDTEGAENRAAEIGWIYNMDPVIEFGGDLSDSPAALKTLTLSSSKFVAGLELADLTVINGSASNFVTLTEGLEYQVDVEASDFGEVTVYLKAGAGFDAYGAENAEIVVSWNYIDASDISNNLNAMQLSLSPNPASNSLSISSTKLVDISIFDMQGKMVISVSDLMNHDMDISQLSAGFYMVQAKYSSGIITKKLIIE